MGSDGNAAFLLKISVFCKMGKSTVNLIIYRVITAIISSNLYTTHIL